MKHQKIYRLILLPSHFYSSDLAEMMSFVAVTHSRRRVRKAPFECAEAARAPRALKPALHFVTLTAFCFLSSCSLGLIRRRVKLVGTFR